MYTIDQKGGEKKSILKMGVRIVAVFLLLGVAGMAQAQAEIETTGPDPFFKPELLTHGG